jgi:predicted metal-dependent phosphoesterase TrpH
MEGHERLEKVGVLHIHSTYSLDGTLSLAECHQVFRNRGYDFMAVTEHGQDLDADKMKRFVDDCLALSDQNFCVVPGLELEFYRETKKTHILAIGITNYVQLPRRRAPSTGCMIKVGWLS